MQNLKTIDEEILKDRTFSDMLVSKVAQLDKLYVFEEQANTFLMKLLRECHQDLINVDPTTNDFTN